MELVQVRECDGKCCEESPRWPNVGSTDCIFHKGNGPVDCKLMLGEAEIPDTCSVLPDLTGQEAFNHSCQNWPESMPEGRDTGGCCLQWVNGD